MSNEIPEGYHVYTGQELLWECWEDYKDFADEKVSFNEFFPEIADLERDKMYMATSALSEWEELENEDRNQYKGD